MEKLNKKIIIKFGEHYLLGKNKEGEFVWLEKPSWDCGWYWGFGYLHTFTNNKEPEFSKDISSHFHFDSSFLNSNIDGFDAFKNYFDACVLSDDEIWQLLELAKTAYTLKETAEVFGRGGSHYTTNKAKDIIQEQANYSNIVEKINKIILPAIFEEIKKLLTE